MHRNEINDSYAHFSVAICRNLQYNSNRKQNQLQSLCTIQQQSDWFKFILLGSVRSLKDGTKGLLPFTQEQRTEHSAVLSLSDDAVAS